ncbi:unnamed protein product [Bursaphelenchus okinawaensis]|uniref:Tyrosine phosphatase n=1 Tax=Bursaphelenchus okinawaensis TaxID=465554 RepID=A0A811LQ50_9BILA|nr:unnamed protein product [Bursaphelenchus okinawaensis]CAG9127759.1 unnamed protein product [Bursaphelenchus okinawaensis]
MSKIRLFRFIVFFGSALKKPRVRDHKQKDCEMCIVKKKQKEEPEPGNDGKSDRPKDDSAKKSNSAKSPDVEDDGLKIEDECPENAQVVDCDLGESMKSVKATKKKKFTDKPDVTYANEFTVRGVEALVKEYSSIHKYDAPGAKFDAFHKNKEKNRYCDVPCLDPEPGNEISPSYYHGNFVFFPNEKTPRYLICEGPLPTTTDTFAKLPEINEVTCIVQLCDWVEMGKAKCYQYIPSEPNKPNPHNITLKSNVEDAEVPEGTTISACTFGNQEVTHVKFTAWPDHCAPSKSKTVTDLINLSKKYNKNKDRPVMVHCSAGIGRSGTFIAMDLLRERFAQFDGSFTIIELLKYIRKYRARAIQTAPQYLFLHVAFLDLLEEKYGAEVVTAKMRTFRKRYDKYIRAVAAKLAHPPPKTNTTQQTTRTT